MPKPATPRSGMLVSALPTASARQKRGVEGLSSEENRGFGVGVVVIRKKAKIDRGAR